MALVLECAVAQFTEPIEGDGAGERVADLALVENAAGTTPLLRIVEPVEHEQDCNVSIARLMRSAGSLIVSAAPKMVSVTAGIDLPAFSTLDRLAGRLRAAVHGRMFGRVAERLAGDDAMALDALLISPPDSTTTPFNSTDPIRT